MFVFLLNNIVFMKFIKNIFTYLFILIFANLSAQYFPKNAPKNLEQKAEKHADSLYQQLSLDEKIGQLYIVALYNNRGEEEIQKIRNLVEKEKIGGLILMQDNAEKHIQLLNEFQGKSKVKMMIGIDENGDCSKDFLPHINFLGL